MGRPRFPMVTETDAMVTGETMVIHRAVLHYMSNSGRIDASRHAAASELVHYCAPRAQGMPDAGRIFGVPIMYLMPTGTTGGASPAPQRLLPGCDFSFRK
jgi:hypothetical protein